MELQIFKNEDDYNKVVKTGGSVDYYITTLNGYEYVMHGPLPFRFINGLNEEYEINNLDIDHVIRTRDTVVIILNLDSQCAAPWKEILIK